MNRQTSASSRGKSFCIIVYLQSPYKQTGGEDLGCLLASPSLLSFNSIYDNAFTAVLLELSQEPPNYAATCPVAYIQNLYICAHMSQESVGKRGGKTRGRRGGETGRMCGEIQRRALSFIQPSFLLPHYVSFPFISVN